MYHVLRRTAVIVASSAVILTGAPLLGTAFAAALTQSGFTVDGNSTTTGVKNSKPVIAGTYSDGTTNATLDSNASTITVTEGTNNTPVDCPKTVSGNQISCTPSGLLSADNYSVAFHAVETAPTAGQSLDTTKTFSIDVPKRTSSSPAASSTVASLTSGMITVTFNESVDEGSSSISVQQIADRNSDGTFSPSTHTPLTGTTKFTGGTALIPMGTGDENDNKTIQFTPDSATLSSGIYRVSTDVFGVTASSSPNTAGTKNPKTEAKDTFTFTLDNTPPTAPSNLAAPTVTQANQTAVPLTGEAKPGNTITVSVSDGVSSPVTNNSSPVTVTNATCSTPTTCSWTVTLNLSGLHEGNLTWTATATNGAGSTPATGPGFLKDTVPPANATVDPPSLPAGSSTLHISGTDNDATLDHYKVKISDSANHTIGADPNPIILSRDNGAVTGNGAFNTTPINDIDVSGLDDGALSITVTPVDVHGNAPTTAPAAVSVTKNAGMQLVFNSSFFKLTNTDTPSFPNVLARANHAIQKPTQIAIVFNNTITLTRNDNGTLPTALDPVTADAPYFVDNNGNGNRLNGTATLDSTDPSHRRLLVTPPPGLTDGGYTLHVSVFEGNGKCDINSDPTGPPLNGGGQSSYGACPSYSDFVKVPNTTTPFTFTVDSQPPAAPVISTTPASAIDGSTVGDVSILVTGEAGSTVALTAKSSGGGSVLALNGGQPVTVGDNGTVVDDENSAAFAALPDGTVTITGTPTDSAGNPGPAGTDTVTLAARPSVPRSLAVSVSETSFTLHWVAPSYDGYPAVEGNAISHLTGYRYTYTDTTDGAVDTSTHIVDVNNAGATSATQGNLLAGHKYDVTLCALNGITGPCNEVDTTANPAFRTTLTAGISKALVVYGNPITLAGRLTRTDIGAGITNEPLTITPHYDNGTTGTVIHITTNATGNWSVTLSKPSKNAVYAVAFNAAGTDPNYQPSNSAVRSLVAVSLRIDKVSSRSTSHVYPVTISGHISPNESGRTLYIYAKVAGANHYQRIGSAKISSTSTWSYTKTFPKGKYYVYANFPSQNGNVGGSCPSVTFTRT